MARRGFAVPHGTPMTDRIYYHVTVDVTTRCWNWLGTIGANGYGRITAGSGLHYAHRLAYEAFVGPIPDGKQIDHLCRNRACCNPDHLEAVSPQVNVLRGESLGAIAQRRDRCINGHEYAVHGFMYRGRRRCRQCNVDYLRAYREKYVKKSETAA